MSRIRATINSIRARLHRDEIAREVETELRFHTEMRTRANIEAGMTPDEAQCAALKSFGDFDNVKSSCCEIRRSFPFDTSLLRMGLHITIAVLAGAAALWTVNTPHHSLSSLLSQLGFVAVLTYLFVVARRNQKPRRQ
ncbi:MAG TPA: permease prefix domain 1-containing protein [Pyrinomonadaceae bacterium]|jgi:hypothetical protein|nr:permease prefix domain 1-containing protein [Pyrinomonadaceae bacterium]